MSYILPASGLVKKFAAFYRAKKRQIRYKTLQKIDCKLFNDYYKIYKDVRLQNYGRDRLFRSTRECVETDAFYKFSDKLVEKYKKPTCQRLLKNVKNSGAVPALSAVAVVLTKMSNILPTGAPYMEATILGTTFVLLGAAVVQNIEQRYSKKHGLDAPTTEEFVYDRIINKDFEFTKQKYAAKAALRFRNTYPAPVNYQQEHELTNERK